MEAAHDPFHHNRQAQAALSGRLRGAALQGRAHHQTVAWGLRCLLSYRDIDEPFTERCVKVDQSTLNARCLPTLLDYRGATPSQPQRRFSELSKVKAEHIAQDGVLFNATEERFAQRPLSGSVWASTNAVVGSEPRMSS